MNKKFERMSEIQMEIDILESERCAVDTEGRKKIDRKINDLMSILDVLQESCA